MIRQGLRRAALSTRQPVQARLANTFGASKPAVKPTATTTSSSASSNASSVVRSFPNKDQEAASAAVWREFDDTPSESTSLNGENWSVSFTGLGNEPFPEKVTNVLTADTAAEDIEITPDGLLYLPEIKYRRMLNKAFGPGGWGLAPRSPTVITPKTVSREYGLVCHGRLVAVARGEQQYFNPDGVPTAIEGCKSNALMRCCKDLGVASEMWDPRFIRTFKKAHCDTKWFEKKRRFVWKRKDAPWEYPYN